MATYRDLVVWQKSVDLAHAIYSATRDFPRAELFGLTSQMQRSAVSLPANIAEGHDRDSTKEYLHHLSFSLGSLAELETLLVLADRLNYIHEDARRMFDEQCRVIGRMLRSLQRALRARLRRKKNDDT
jgi:four helix bundle protein